MASKAERDTAAAKAKQGGGQAAKDHARAKARTAEDTARAKSRQGGGQAAKDHARAKARTAEDTARAKSRQNGGDGGTADDFSQREAAAGLNLAGNDTTAGRGELSPTFAQREAAAGLNLAGNDTTAGRDDFYSNPSKPPAPWASFDSGEMKAGSEMAFEADVPSGGGGGLLGLEVLRANGEYIYIPEANIVADYDPDNDTYWSVVFEVENGVFTGEYTFDELASQWEEDDDGDQTKYRLRIFTGVEESIFTGDSADTDILSIQLSSYGQYRESIICRDGEPVTVLTKSS